MRKLTTICSLILASFVSCQDGKNLKTALGDLKVSDSWIYDDIKAGYAEAKKTGNPLLVSFR